MLCFRTLCVLGGGICRPRVNGLARVDERGACFVVVPIKYSVGVRHALIAPQSYDVRVHVYTYSKLGYYRYVSGDLRFIYRRQANL